MNLVAQISNLLYRMAFSLRSLRTYLHVGNLEACRLEIGDTADWKSALLPSGLMILIRADNWRLPLSGQR